MQAILDWTMAFSRDEMFKVRGSEELFINNPHNGEKHLVFIK